MAKEGSMCKEYKRRLFINTVTVLCAGILFAGCVTTQGNLALPYEGTVSSSGRAFAVVNTGSGDGLGGATWGGEEVAGVQGRANNTGNVSNYGGYFIAKGIRGTGVYSLASNNGDSANLGGEFVANGLKGTGVHGSATHNGNERNYGGYFSAAGQKGEGVHTIASGQNGVGVYADAYGSDGIGVFGLARSIEPSINYGGYFLAHGQAGRGVYGEANGENGHGVSAVARGKKGTAVYGEAHHAEEDTNYGGYFIARGKYGRGLFAKGGPSGYAGEFRGTVATDVLVIQGGTDLSERFEIRKGEGLSPVAGMVVSIDPESPGKLVVSTKAYDRKAAGIISGAANVNSGIIMGNSDSVTNGEHPVALSGRVYCLVDASKGSIQPGDLLTTSDNPGHAMKVTDYARAQGAILGKAMTRLESGQGLVLVLVCLQ
jgi:hypothetical protein